MSRKTLWTFGCSFTAEYHPVGHPQQRSNYDDYKDWRGGNLPKVWPTVLAEMMDYDVKNCGEGGAANQTIFWKFILSFCQNIYSLSNSNNKYPVGCNK